MYRTVLSEKEEDYIKLNGNDLEDFEKCIGENLRVVVKEYLISWMEECNKKKLYVKPVSLERTKIDK